jgi:hypothetical protein
MEAATLLEDSRGYQRYFISLERTVKSALAFYLTVLAVGFVMIALGTARATELARDADAVISAGAGLIMAGAGSWYLVSTIHWLGELHIWLDSRFFGFLKKSNDVIFHTFLKALEEEDRARAQLLGADQREKFMRAVLTRLADDSGLFRSLMTSGIFRLWIWYWVMNYGTFACTILCFVAFAVMLGGNVTATRPIFSFFWAGALIHLAANVMLGNILTRMTRSVSELLLDSIRPKLALLLKEHRVS